MKVLLVGGYGYLGYRLARRFHGDNHRIVIIDENDEKPEGFRRIPHKFFKIAPSNSDCEKIFQTGPFDTVIYLYSGFSERWQKEPDRGSSQSEDLSMKLDFSGFVNILNLSTKYQVNKFVFITSSEIYGNSDIPCKEDSELNPVTLRGMADFVKEHYAFKWKATHNLEILSIRISEIYGPGDWQKNNHFPGKANIISEYIKKIIDGEELVVRGYGTETLDFLYIEDAVEAIYQASISEKCTGVFNISSNTEVSVNSIIEALKALSRVKKVVYEKVPVSELSTQIQRSRLSNSKIKNVLGWSPTFSLQEGLKRTLEWHYSRKKAEKKSKLPAEVKKSKRRKISKVYIGYIENLLIFFAVAFLQWGHHFFGISNIKFFNIEIDYSIIYILLMGVLWGQKQAYIAMLLSLILYVGATIYSGVDIVTFVYTPENLVRIMIYLVVGILTGYSIERKNREIESKDLNIQSLGKKYNFLLDVYNETKIVKEELESQVIETEDSFSAIYRTVQEVDSLEIEKVFAGAVLAVERIMKTDQVSIYTLSDGGTNNFMRLRARSISLEDRIPNSVKISEVKEIEEVVKTKTLYVNRKLDPDVPLMIAPVLDDGKVIAIVSVHRANFKNITVYYENLFQTVVGLITNALKRAYFFEASLRDKRYIPDTRILTASTFENILAQVRNNKKELGMSYTLLKVEKDWDSYTSLSNKVASSIRDNDYIGLGKDGNVYILLSNTKSNYANLVIERLKGRGVNASLVTEEFVDEVV
ncbi:MAG: NAD-dependent epimerase/dehydratase family protein [Actinobacteria bacterium]|nr:NAD-dependent epimerase/dehydratase family protein [Actinomycetota bacterium]